MNGTYRCDDLALKGQFGCDLIANSSETSLSDNSARSQSGSAVSGSPVAINCRNLVVQVRRRPQATVVTFSGEVDAFNAGCITAYTRCFNSTHGALIVDLRCVEFFSLAGLQTLLQLDEERKQAASAWALLPSRAVSRLMRHCSSEVKLPIAGTFGD